MRTVDASILTGLTLRQLQMLAVRKWVTVSFWGPVRVWSGRALLIAYIYAELRRKGFGTGNLNHIMKQLNKDMPADTQYILAVHRRLVFASNEREAIERSVKADAGVILLDIGEMKRQIERSMDTYRVRGVAA